MALSAGPSDSNAPFDHLTPENQLRLRHILAVRVENVHTAIRGAETQTRFESSIGRVNLNEAFSHVAELAANTSLSHEEQASHLADIEDHLRRAVMEHPEQVLREKLAQLDELWERYLLEAREYRERKAMIGVPYHSELEDDRQEIEALMEEVRAGKTSRREWDDTLDLAAKMTKAAGIARRLDDKLRQCIGAARQLKEEDSDKRGDARRGWWSVRIAAAGLLAAVVFGVGGFLWGKSESSSDRTKASTTPAKTTKAP